MRYFFLGIGFFICMVSGCMDALELELPPLEKSVFVECYLTPGRLLELRLGEVASLSQDIRTIPPLRDAWVRIRSNGQWDTLSFAVQDGYYRSGTALPVLNQDPIELVVQLPNGATLSASTDIPELVDIDSLSFAMGSNGKYALAVSYSDPDPNLNNFFRLYAGSNSAVSKSVFSDVGQGLDQNLYLTDFIFSPGELVDVRLLHITPEYHDFYASVENGNMVSQSPFAEPGLIKTNIQGGTGIFTGFDFNLVQVVVPQ